MRLRYGVNEEPNAHIKIRVSRLHREIHVNRVVRYATQQLTDLENGVESALKILPPSMEERNQIERVVEDLIEDHKDAIVDMIDSMAWIPKELRVYLQNAIESNGDMVLSDQPDFKYFRFDTIGQPPSPDKDPGPQTSDR